MSFATARRKDALAMLVAIQATLFVHVLPDGEAVALLLVPVVVTPLVVLREAARRVGEYRESQRANASARVPGRD